ncbi:GlxA family transcriptional regulator [Pseudophaeobacter sp.]|uniref:GlxA family transcriptional regulator n=1 Tax=Pseudophaeobacter sp. TaxID=1971739 RepID=UPI004059429D
MNRHSPTQEIPKEPITLGFLIFPGFPMACLTSAIEPLRAANEIAGRDAFAWKILADQEGPIASSAGVSFAPDHLLGEAGELQHLFFVSSPNGQFDNPTKANAILHRHLRTGGSLGAFSGGIFPLARSRIMEGLPMSVHWCYEAAFQAEFPDVEAHQTVLNDQGPCKTASGSAAVFDLMLNLIEQELGPEITTETACWFQHPYVRSADVPQRLPVLGNAAGKDMLPPKVAQAIKLFAEHIEEPIQISAVAEAINMSARSLERSFKRATGQSPLKYYRQMRMNEARQLVLYSRDPITSIAYMVGYSSPSAFQRHYRDIYGISPLKDREAKNSLRVTDGNCLPSV